MISKLRNEMIREGIDAYLIPSSDYNGSEYVNPHFRCREYMSGFTGSAGTLLVEKETARLWTDGRYFIQAQKQLEGTGIILMKSGEPGVPEPEEYLAETLSWEDVLGFYGKAVDAQLATRLRRRFITITGIDLVGRIWEDRPPVKFTEIYPVGLHVTGESSESKLARVREEMERQGADYLVVSRLEDLAWLYNLRGSDIPNTPVFYGFALISRENDEIFFQKEYMDIYERISWLRNCTVMLCKGSASCAVSDSLHVSVRKIYADSPVEKLKAVKNSVEIHATKAAHIRDGAAMTEFIYRMKHRDRDEVTTELSVCDLTEELRRKQGAVDLSFSTIAAWEEHGAIIHYSPTEETDIPVEGEGFLLVDSGGQYPDGTTDITRTVALGEVPQERKEAYTAVLKGHIALAKAEFDENTDGAMLDTIARRPINDLGYDYRHGTGHGVGHLLSVHEGPNVISPRGKGTKILPGMITTDEPGIYIEGDFGIRIENELLCVEKDGHFAFEPLTLCPYEMDAVDSEMLTEDEKEYIISYHKKVYETVGHYLSEEAQEWLRELACTEFVRKVH